PLFSLVGVPPLSGFWAKIFLIEGGFADGQYLSVLAIILGSVVTLIIIAKIWTEVFWKEGVELPKREYIKYFHELRPSKQQAVVMPILLLATSSLFLGFAAEYVIQVSKHIAADLTDTSSYIVAVLVSLLPLQP